MRNVCYQRLSMKIHRIFASFCYCGWNVDTLFYTLEKKMFKLWTISRDSTATLSKTISSVGKVITTFVPIFKEWCSSSNWKGVKLLQLDWNIHDCLQKALFHHNNGLAHSPRQLLSRKWWIQNSNYLTWLQLVKKHLIQTRI